MALRFRKQLIALERYESAGIFDVNNDGILDIVSGAWWYEGPEFSKKHWLGSVPASGDYFEDFSTIPLDVNGNGLTDFITGGWFDKTLRWMENPGDGKSIWKSHIIDECGNIETARAWDVDGDGILEVIPNTPNNSLVVYKLETDKQARGASSFKSYKIREEAQGHGLGFGDISGNGRGDFVLNSGWLEAPEKPFEEKWLWHPDFDLGSASVPIIVADVNGDGLNDLIVGQSHKYGLSWWEQKIENERREWIEHPIDPYNSQYHDMRWIDIDGDGECELVTGKRYMAHCGGDPGANDPAGIYYFKWNGECFVKQIIDYGNFPAGKGCGIYFDMADLTGNGLPDIVAPGKDGLYIFFNEGE